METWQQIIIGLYAVYSLSAAVLGYRYCKFSNKAYGLTPWYYPLGAFVWGDAFIFGIFWIIAALIILSLNDWLLFCFAVSVFWAVRGLGETIYWLNQQFSTVKRVPYEGLPGYGFVQNDAIWFINQIVAQCVTVISVTASVYFGVLWIKSLGM